MENEKQRRMHELVDKIRKADTAYYLLDNPAMPDRAYDALVEELKGIEEETGVILSGSPLHKVAGEVLDVLEKVQHTRPMLSADKTKSMDKVAEFVDARTCLVSWKLDGLTIVLRYDGGELQQAITRGAEGRIGEDVTHTVRKMTNVPLTISYNGPLEVRGEGIISWENFEAINSGLEVPYDHPRNLAAGCVRRKDARKMEKYPVDFIAYEVVGGPEIQEKYEQHQYLRRQGFEAVQAFIIPKNAARSTIDEIIDLFNRKNCPRPVDGLIIEYNDLVYGRSLGVTGHHEKRMLAFKWEDEVHKTVFRGLAPATTRTGMVSLTAMFDDVEIDGTTVNRAYLHNLDYISDLQLGVGDTITVYKANQIIPQIAENKTQSNTLQLPTECPCCGGKLVVRQTENGTRMLYCENKACSSQLLMKFVHFCSKTRMNLPGMSEKTLAKLIDAGLVQNFGDLFCLENVKEAVASLPGLGPNAAQNMIDVAEKARHCHLNQFLAGLGIHTIGRTASRVISNYFGGSWSAFEYAVQDGFDFTQLDDFGPTMNLSIYGWYADSEREKLWRPALKHIEFIIEKEQEIMNTNNPFNGKTVVATGKMENFTRDGIQMKLLTLGAKPGSSVSSKTDYVIAGPGAGSKLDKAQKLGVQVLDEEQFLSMLPEGDPDRISA